MPPNLLYYICIDMKWREKVMFSVGDKIVYPMQGAGVIQGIEEKKILGQTRQYYTLKLPGNDINIMIPVDSSESIGIREVLPEEEMRKILDVLSADSTPMDPNWNRRYRENMEKLKSGDINQVAGVVRNLVRNDRVKSLSTGERKLLNGAKKILLSEFVLSMGITWEEAESMVEEAI